MCIRDRGIDFPDSIVSYFEGMMGQPEGGFPKDLQKLILKDKEPITCRPGELLPPEDFDYIKSGLQKYFDLEGTPQEIISYAMYPKVFEDYQKSLKNDGNFRYMGSDIFFHGLEEGETCEVKLEEGKVPVSYTHLKIRPTALPRILERLSSIGALPDTESVWMAATDLPDRWFPLTTTACLSS